VKSLSELTVDDLVDEFEFLGTWEDRCDYLIDLGFELPEMPAEEKNEQNRVHGCQSMVWMTVRPYRDEAGQTRLEVRADSDAMLVKGLIAVLLTVYDGKTPREILETDVASVFKKLGLDRHLSSARKNGLAGMVKRIQQEAARTAA
jgi:cysteine desulfuration protein SufE